MNVNGYAHSRGGQHDKWRARGLSQVPSISRTTRAGTPATTVCGGIFDDGAGRDDGAFADAHTISNDDAGISQAKRRLQRQCLRPKCLVNKRPGRIIKT